MNMLRFLHCFIKKIMKPLNDNNLAIHSAEAAFFIIIAFFPTTMLFLTLMSYLPFSSEQMQDFSIDFLPREAAGFVESLLSEVFRMHSGAVVSVATITALWSSSRGVLAIIKGLNSIYDVEEKRGFIRLRLVSMLYMLSLMLILIITLVVLVFGGIIASWLIDTFPLFKDATGLFKFIRWFLGSCLLILFFWVLFTFAPGKHNRFLQQFPGAVISALGWLAFSALYSFYITHFANYSYLYGSLTAIVLLMLWLYFCMNIMFFGAQSNVLIRAELDKRKRIKAKTRSTKE